MRMNTTIMIIEDQSLSILMATLLRKNKWRNNNKNKD